MTLPAALQGRADELQSGPDCLPPLAAAILVALEAGLASDSRHLCRILGVEHALLLREIALLQDRELVAVDRRDPRTLRTHIRPTGG